MIRSVFSLFLVTVLLMIFTSCSSQTSEIIATYGDNEISVNDFKNAYVKSVGNLEEAKNDSLEQLKSYLDLFINYKMKLRDAEIRAYDKDNTVKTELENYKNQIGKSYIEEKFVNKPALEQLYKDAHYEYKFKHILVKPDTIGRKTAYELATELIQRIKNGESFDELAKKYSSDMATKNSGGEIYFIRPDQLPLAKFVDALTDATPGVVYDKPVMSLAGYHVVLVVDKRPVRYRISVSHIMRDFKNDEGQPDTADALSVIQEVQKQINEGVSFDSLAVKYSEDPGSKVRGGDLGAFPRRSMVVDFDSTVFNLKVGEVSGIIKTNFGFHIAKCTGEEKFPAFNELEPQLKQFYDKNHKAYRVEQLKEKLKDEYNLKINNSCYAAIQTDFDSTKFAGYWNSGLRSKIKSINIFSLADKNYSIDELFELNKENQGIQNSLVDSNLVKRLVSGIIDKLIFDLKVDDLVKNDPEFKDIMEEYKNGILIFKLQEEEVWSTINMDSLGMYEYYDKNREKYQWKSRVAYNMISSKSDSLIQELYKSGDTSEKFDAVFEEITNNRMKNVETKSVDLVETSTDFFSEKANELKNIGDVSQVLKNDKKWFFLKITDRRPAGPKSFEEAINEITGPYQEIQSKAAEAKYIEKLKSIYKPVVHYELLNNLFQ